MLRALEARVGKVMNEYGLFVVDAEEITTYTKAEEEGSLVPNWRIYTNGHE